MEAYKPCSVLCSAANKAMVTERSMCCAALLKLEHRGDERRC